MTHLRVDGRSVRIEGSQVGPLETVVVDEKPISVEVLRELSKDPVDLILRTGNKTLRVTAREAEDGVHFLVKLDGKPFEVEWDTSKIHSTMYPAKTVRLGPLVITAPMAGRIVALKADLGNVVDAGQALVVLEAMKMENEVAAPIRGVVKELYVRPGSLVRLGERLVLLE